MKCAKEQAKHQQFAVPQNQVEEVNKNVHRRGAYNQNKKISKEYLDLRLYVI